MKRLISPSKGAGGAFLAMASRFFIRDVNTVKHLNGGNVIDGISRVLGFVSTRSSQEEEQLVV